MASIAVFTSLAPIAHRATKIPTVTDYFESREDAENQYQKFVEIFSRLPQKGLVFSPCICLNRSICSIQTKS